MDRGLNADLQRTNAIPDTPARATRAHSSARVRRSECRTAVRNLYHSIALVAASLQMPTWVRTLRMRRSGGSSSTPLRTSLAWTQRCRCQRTMLPTLGSVDPYQYRSRTSSDSEWMDHGSVYVPPLLTVAHESLTPRLVWPGRPSSLSYGHSNCCNKGAIPT